MKKSTLALWRRLALTMPLVAAPGLIAQEIDDEEIIELSPFEVSEDSDVGYLATSTLAGTRIRTDLRDVGSAISVVTEEFLKDTGATDNQSLLMYTTGTEVGGVGGNYAGADIGDTASERSTAFTNPNSNNRVRGLAQADNTRGYFRSNVPWDGYNVSRVDMQRGPNSMLFGLGSPAGVINVTLDGASFYDEGEMEFRFGSYESTRFSLNVNREILDDELAIRVAGLIDREKYRQKPAFEDDTRLYAAVRYEPSFLKTDWASTTITANYEFGRIDRNAPRTLTPIDKITPWFRSSRDGDDFAYGLDQGVFNLYHLQDDISQLPNRGQARPNYNVGGAPNPYYLPALGNFAQIYSSPVAFYPNHDSAEMSGYALTEMTNSRMGEGGRAADGTIDNGIGGFPYNRWASVAGYSEFGRRAGLEWSNDGMYRDYHLSDRTVFDFYNNLIDGPNKESWTDFDTYNITVAENFWNNRAGIEVAYDVQDFEDGRQSLLDAGRQAIFIDVNTHFPDGRENPNVGRPFVSDSVQYGNNNRVIDREVLRATAYAELNLSDFMDPESWITRLLGRHMFTGLYSDDEFEEETRNWMRYGTGDDWGALVDLDNDPFNANERQVNTVSYLGPSLLGRSSASGAYIPRVQALRQPSSGPIGYFNATWNAPDVAFDAPWFQPITLQDITQSENPENYVGWSTTDLTVIPANDQTRDSLTTQARKSRQVVESQALIWQGYFWNGAIVGTYGWRKDKVDDWTAQAPLASDQRALVNDPNYVLEPSNSGEYQSQSWSVVAHVNELLGRNDILPVNVSLFYNEGENFNPAGTRVDVLDNPISPPMGQTQDQSILIATKDNKYSLKITKFRTSVQNASSAGLGGSWYIGALERWGGNWANIFEYDLGGSTLDSQGQGDAGRYNYGPAEGETAEDAAAREAAAVAAWRAHQQKVRDQFPEFYPAWTTEDPGVYPPKEVGERSPVGFTLTEDTVSEGYEFEFVANPTPNWRISVNATKVKASRSNVGGVNTAAWMNFINDELNNTAAGDLRIWWGGAGNETTLFQWNANVGSQWNLIQLKEGTRVDELREWRFNVVTNYSFDEGFLRGVNVGGSYRWEDDIVIGYPAIRNADGTASYDIDNPYHGPTEDFVDVWIGYSRPINDKIDWRIQLNVRNLFAEDKLIPLSTQPDGSVAAWRIPPNRTWMITNTISF